VNPGASKREVYFPRGSDWIDWHDGTRIPGGTLVTIAAPLDVLPLFVRAGASIPTQPVVQHTGEMKGTPLTLTVALGGPGSSRIYEDAGDGYGYRNGESRTLVVEQNAAGVKLTIPPNHGWQKLGAVEFVGVEKAPASVRIDGKSAREVQFDASTHRLHVALPDENLRSISLVR
jgi:alpha-glucosidase